MTNRPLQPPLMLPYTAREFSDTIEEKVPSSKWNIQGDPDHPSAMFFSGTVNPKKLDDYIGVKLPLKNIFKNFQDRNKVFLGVQNLILKIEMRDDFF